MNVLIIGATFGIGHELAKQYVNSSDTLVLLGRTEAKLEEFKKEFSDRKAKIITDNLDVTIASQCAEKISNILKICPVIDKVIYC